MTADPLAPSTSTPPGRPWPLGATWDGSGVNVALYARGAYGVDVCLFDEAGRETQTALAQRSAYIWHGYLPGAGPGQRYGFRVDGPFAPPAGARWNRAKLLLDPYARAIDGELTPAGVASGAIFGGTTEPDRTDSAPYVPRSVVVSDTFDWGDDRPPATAWGDTVIYELHVRGFTRRHPDVPAKLRGTYAGLASPAAVEHLRGLGITAVELLPVQQFVSEPRLLSRGLVNYWGYNTVGFFAPHAAYSSSGAMGEQVTEFKSMVKTLHAAGIEVILDVVYNHTGESNEGGPTLSFRGIDNPTYYRLRDVDRGLYRDYTGCGNTVDLRNPQTLQLVTDSLRYWVTEMHVDGFRFDLAPALARSPYSFDPRAAFLTVLQQDPVLSRVKLLAEPWDAADGGYQVGRFPAAWAEWNGRYRDAVRDFWRGTAPNLADLGSRLAGSADLYARDDRLPTASVNYVTCHDGFPVADLVSYAGKHNEANLDDNRDGSNDERSFNCGAEGPTSDEGILALRRRQVRNLLGTVLLSAGVPMLLAGDEMGRTQGGNNNGYCQDNETSWLSWALSEEDAATLAFIRRLVALRRDSPTLRQTAFFRGQPVDGSAGKDLAWFTPHGSEVTDGDWYSPTQRTLGGYLSGDALREPGPGGERVADASYLLLMHAGGDPCDFTLPPSPYASEYDVVLDTWDDEPPAAHASPLVGSYRLRPQSLVLLRARDGRST